MLKALVVLLLLVLVLMVLIGGASIGAAITTTNGATSSNGCGVVPGGCIRDGSAEIQRMLDLTPYPDMRAWWEARPGQ